MNDTIDTGETGAKQHPVKVKPFRENLACAIPDTERLERATRSADRRTDAKKLREDMEKALEHAKANAKKTQCEIDDLESDADKLLLEVKDGIEYRSVDCERRFNYRLRKVEEVRLDTNKLLRERPMEAHELQRELDLDKPESAGTGGADLADPDDEDSDDETEDDDEHVVDDDYDGDTEEDPDTSVLDTKVGDVITPPESDYNPDEPQPRLATQKAARKPRAPKGEGKGSRGGKAKS